MKMVPQKISIIAGSLLLSGAAGAAITALAPNSVSASTSVNDTQFDETNLYDGDVSQLTVGALTGFGDDYAGVGAGPHTVVFDFGSAFNFTDAFYAQRNDVGNPVADKVNTIRIWFLNSNPGAATTSLPGTLGTADVTLSPDTVGSELEQFSASGNGRYIVAELTGIGNSGAAEFRFDGTAVPEPTALGLLALTGFGLLRRRR